MNNNTNIITAAQTIIDSLTPDSPTVTIITDVKTQRTAAAEYVTAAADFAAYCTAQAAVGFTVSVNRKALLTAGMTAAQYETLSNQLTALRYCLIDFISADRAHAADPDSPEKTKLMKVKRSLCFETLKVIKAMFHIDTPCAAGDISYIAYKAMNLTYRDRQDIRKGYTIKPCGTISLLNTVLRYCTAAPDTDSRLSELNTLTAKKKAAVCAALKDTISQAQLTAAAPSTAPDTVPDTVPTAAPKKSRKATKKA